MGRGYDTESDVDFSPNRGTSQNCGFPVWLPFAAAETGVPPRTDPYVWSGLGASEGFSYPNPGYVDLGRAQVGVPVLRENIFLVGFKGKIKETAAILVGTCKKQTHPIVLKRQTPRNRVLGGVSAYFPRLDRSLSLSVRFPFAQVDKMSEVPQAQGMRGNHGPQRKTFACQVSYWKPTFVWSVSFLSQNEEVSSLLGQ